MPFAAADLAEQLAALLRLVEQGFALCDQVVGLGIQRIKVGVRRVHLGADGGEALLDLGHAIRARKKLQAHAAAKIAENHLLVFIHSRVPPSQFRSV